MYYILIALILGLFCGGCAIAPTHMSECRNLCVGEKVAYFKDDVTTCKCNLGLGSREVE